MADALFGPNPGELEQLTTDCDTFTTPPIEQVEGSTSLAWSIQHSATVAEDFYTAGFSDVGAVHEDASFTEQLPFRDRLGTLALAMPVQSQFLVEPDDWFCLDDLGMNGNNSVFFASAFDVVETGLAVGALKADMGNSMRSDGFWVNDQMSINRFAARYDSENDTAALGAALRSEGWVHAVGMERIAEPGQVLWQSNVFRVGHSNLLLALIFRDVDRALEWRFENGSPSVVDLNDRINESEHPGVVLLSASDVNGSGSISGLAYRNTTTDDWGYFGYLLTEENELTDLDQLRLDSSVPVPCYADINGDRKVDGGDLGLCLGSWGQTGECMRADLNGNGVIDGADLGFVLGQWNATCSY